MTRMLTLAGIVSLLAMLAAPAPAAEFYDFNGTDVLVEYWAGTGTNEAIMVVDFTNSTPSGASYAFGYRWDGDAYGWDMMSSIAAAGAFQETHTDWGIPLGMAIDSISYDGFTTISDWQNSFLGYWGSTNGTDWSINNDGVSNRPLTDGDFDGWSSELVANGYSPIYAPLTPTPEPASMALLSIGAVGLLRKRRRK